MPDSLARDNKLRLTVVHDFDRPIWKPRFNWAVHYWPTWYCPGGRTLRGWAWTYEGAIAAGRKAYIQDTKPPDPPRVHTVFDGQVYVEDSEFFVTVGPQDQ